MRNFLVSPPFAEKVPARIRFDTASVGLFFAAWSALGLIEQSISFQQVVLTDFQWTELQTSLSALILLSSVGLEVGAVLSLVGGLLMFRLHRGGKTLVVCGLMVGIASDIANMVAYRLPAIDIVAQVAGTAILFLFYLMVVVSRPSAAVQVATVEAQVLPG
jgi:hypothetical protein